VHKYIRLAGALLALLTSAGAQVQQVNPASQIKWPAVTGVVAPVTPAVPCSAVNYGQPYTNVTSGTQYVCVASGWVTSGGGGGTIPPTGIPNSNGVSYDSSFLPLGTGDSILTAPSSGFLPTTGLNYVQVDSSGNSRSTPFANLCAGNSPTCLIYQNNPAPCSTPANLSGYTAGDAVLTVSSTACLSPVGVAFISNGVESGFWLSWNGISGSTLTGVSSTAVWGSTATNQSSAVAYQVTEAKSSSATANPYYISLQNSSVNYGQMDLTNSSLGMNIAANTTQAVNTFSFTSGFLSYKPIVVSGLTAALFTPTITAENSYGGPPALCATADIFLHASSAAPAVQAWDTGQANGSCTFGANGLNPGELYFRYNGVTGMRIQPNTFNLSTIGNVNAAAITISGLPNATSLATDASGNIISGSGGGGGAVSSVTTSGSSGPATLISGVLNVPVYTPSSGGYLLTSPSGSQVVATPTNFSLAFSNTYGGAVFSDNNESYTATVTDANNLANSGQRSWTANSVNMNCYQQGENYTGFWTTCNPFALNFGSNVRGIMDGTSFHMTHQGQGDTFGEYDYCTFTGGNVQGDDEAQGCKKWQQHQLGYISGTVSNGAAGVSQNYGSGLTTGITYVNSIVVIPYTGSLGSITLLFPTTPTAGTAHVYLNTRTPGTNTFTPTTDIPVSITATGGAQTFVSGIGFSPVTATQGQYVSVYIPSGSGTGYQSTAGYTISGVPTVGTPAVYASGAAPSIMTTMAAPALGSTSILATGTVANGYNDAMATNIAFPDGFIAYDKTNVISTNTVASSGQLSGFGNSIYYNLASGSVTPSTAWGNIVPGTCTPSYGTWVTNQQTQTITCTVNVLSGTFTTSSHLFLNGGFQEEVANPSVVTSLLGGQQTITFLSRYGWGGAYQDVMMQGGPGGEVMIPTPTINSWPIGYWVIGATSSTQLIISNCVQGACNAVGANLPPGAPVSATMVLVFGQSMVRSGGTVTLSNVSFAVQNFGVGSTITVTGATPSDLNGTFTVLTNSNDSIGNVNITWAQAGASESTSTNATFTAALNSDTFYKSAFITGSLSGATGGVQLGVNNVNWTLGDTIVGAPTSTYSASALYTVTGQTTPVSGSNPSYGLVVQDDGPASVTAAFYTANNGGGGDMMGAHGGYSKYFDFTNRPSYNGCVICIFGGEPLGGANKPYYLFSDTNTGFGGILIDPLNLDYKFSQKVIVPSIASTAVSCGGSTPYLKYDGTCGTLGSIPDVTISFTSTGSMAAGACTAVATVAMAGIVTTGVPTGVLPAYQGDATSVAGWNPGGGMMAYAWPSAPNTASYKFCNGLPIAQTPASLNFTLVAK
jgi:hypothetical protein